MAYCNQCGAPLSDNSKFCNQCGAPAPAPVCPVQPARHAAPVVSGKTKALAFVGLGLSIEGFPFCLLAAFYAIFGMIFGTLAGADNYTARFAFSSVFGLYTWIFGFFALAFGIVGRALCVRSEENGNPSRVCRIGAGLGTANIIITSIMLFFALINLFI